MDLWIRSQDRKILSKTSEIYIDDTDENEIIIFNYDSDILGVYKAEERALEVLDEIQNALLNKWANNVKYEEHFDNENPRSLVYIMPKE